MDGPAFAALVMLSLWGDPQTIQQPVVEGTPSGVPRTTSGVPGTTPIPLVLVVGCARANAEPHVWTLTEAGERVDRTQPAITAAEKTQLATHPPGANTYQLIGVADFVDAETSRTIGARGAILPLGRVNTTGELAHGRKVAVKGLYIDGKPARINLTSVADLGSCDGV